MRVKLVSAKVLRNALLLLTVSLLLLNFESFSSLTSAQPVGSFKYEFIVDEDGSTIVDITYRSNRGTGDSWVFVPKFSEWTNRTVRGKVTEWSLCDTKNLTNIPFYFYEALCFSFKSDGSDFEMNIQFNLSTAAMIIEPDGIFYSPQIGFKKGNLLTAEVRFPYGFNVNQDEAIAFGSSNSYQPSSTGSNSNYVLFDNFPETENLIRIEIGFKTSNEKPELLTFKSGIFTFETAPRYAEEAREILDLYNRTYRDFVNLFNITLEKAEVRFFLPDFKSLFSVGGYVPFSGERMGNIHINIIFTRYVAGYIEVIALHELVHHFLWKTGISPQNLLWFHEGMAQYVSIQVANGLGYEGSEMLKKELEEGVLQLKQRVGEDFGFLKDWSPSSSPQDLDIYYVASYYVVSRLAEPLGGLDYYARFFKVMKGATVDNNAALGYYLSIAANESVVTTLNRWGFRIPDLYMFSPFLGDIEEVLNEVNPLFQPYKFLAEQLYKQSLANAEEGNVAKMQLYLVAAILIARSAPLLSLITISGVLFGAIMWALKKKGVFSNY